MTGYRQNTVSALAHDIIRSGSRSKIIQILPIHDMDMDSYLNKARATAGRWVVLPMVYGTSIRLTLLIHHPIRR